MANIFQKLLQDRERERPLKKKDREREKEQRDHDIHDTGWLSSDYFQ